MPRTTGRIHHSPDLSRHGQQMVYAADGNLLANVGSFRRNDAEDLANAEHVVKCWNACEGMTDPEKAVRKTRKALSEAIKFLETHPHPLAVDFSDHLEALRKSLDAIGKA